MGITHSKVSGIADGADTSLVRPSDWNAAHTVTDIVLNQGAADDEILEGKSSDVAHALTSEAETDTYFLFKKISAANGGLKLVSIAEDAVNDSSLQFWALGAQGGTTKSRTGVGLIDFIAAEHDGAGTLANITSNGNVFSVRALVGGTYKTLFLLDEDSDVWVWGNLTLSTGKGVADTDGDTKIQLEESADEDKIRMDVGGTEAFLLSDIGVQTLAKQSGARAYLSADQTTRSGHWVTHKHGTESYDIQNEFNISRASSTATAGTAGTTLKDSTNPFVAGDVGKTVWNDTDFNQTTTIATYVAADEVTLTADVDIDDGDDYTFGYSRFTATEAGKYIVVSSSYRNSADVVADKLYGTAIYKNGAWVAGNYSHASHAGHLILQATDTIDMSANDYLEGASYQISGGAIAAKATHSWLAVYKIA